MKHIFIVNPVAGRGSVQRKLIQDLEKRSLDFYITKGAYDATKYVKAMCESYPNETIRFYACGGDGTLNEVVNGAFGADNAEIGAVPAGSGNDFIRNFDVPRENFANLDKQMLGSATYVDVVRFTEVFANSKEDSLVDSIGNLNDNKRTHEYAINMFNIGFDCNVVVQMLKVKKYPFLRGSLAYMISILITLIKKEGANVIVEFDDGTSYDGHVLLTAIGNGCFCGGGLKGVPHAHVANGHMDICLIKDVPRRTIISLLSKFADGSYLEVSELQKHITYKKCKSVVIERNENNRNLCVDGEVKTMNKKIFEVVPNAVKFSIPSL